MAKITLSFKSKPIQAYFFEIGQSISVGRDEGNDVFIDSLAVAPVHAKLTFSETNSTIEPAENNTPIYINGEQITTAELRHGDKVAVGKHTLEYSEEKPVIENAFKTPDSEFTAEQTKLFNKKPRIGKLQILSGVKAGQVIPLNQSQVRIGSEHASMVEFVQCSDGYYLSATNEREIGSIQLNNQCLFKQALKITDGDQLKIDDTELLFFIE
jgi:hypothetical protein